MSNKTTITIVDAFLSHKPKAIGNSHTDGQTLCLHGNRTAWHGEHNGAVGVFLTLAGWDTRTTKERLRGVLQMMGHQSAHVDNRPVLNIWTKNHQTKIGEVGGDAIDLDPTDVAFVAHPATAKGLAAVRKVEA